MCVLFKNIIYYPYLFNQFRKLLLYVFVFEETYPRFLIKPRASDYML